MLVESDGRDVAFVTCESKKDAWFSVVEEGSSMSEHIKKEEEEEENGVNGSS